jgi:hypothetical protein
VILGALFVILAWWMPVTTLRDGRFEARGGRVVTRRKNPVWFWSALTVQSLIVLWLGWYVCSLAAQWLRSA